MKVLFKSLPSNNPSLFPEDILDKIRQNHPVRLVNQVVYALYIENIIKQYKGGRTTSYHHAGMVTCCSKPI